MWFNHPQHPEVYKATNEIVSLAQRTVGSGGIDSYFEVAFNCEGELSMYAVKGTDGESFALVDYSPSTKTGRAAVSDIFTWHQFCSIASENEDFDLLCSEWGCENWDREDCPEHSNLKFREAWNTIEALAISFVK